MSGEVLSTLGEGVRLEFGEVGRVDRQERPERVWHPQTALPDTTRTWPYSAEEVALRYGCKLDTAQKICRHYGFKQGRGYMIRPDQLLTYERSQGR